MKRLIERRTFLIGGATAALAVLPLRPAMSSKLHSLASAEQLTARVSQFVSVLDDSKRKKATFAWDGSEWRSWNYFGGGGFIKPGLRLEEMNASERDATWNVLASVLSQSGLAKAKNVMLLQDILAAAGNGRGVRSSKRFSIAIFGSPGADGKWGVRLEGHHLSLSFAVSDNEIVSLTPAAFAALPNRVTSGLHRGLVTLAGRGEISPPTAGRPRSQKQRASSAQRSQTVQHSVVGRARAP